MNNNLQESIALWAFVTLLWTVVLALITACLIGFYEWWRDRNK